MYARRAAVLGSAAAMTLGLGAVAAAPASAHPVGLVAVEVSDVDVDVLNKNQTRLLNNVLHDNEVNVGVVAQVVANVCDVNVGGILGELRDTGTATCDAAGGAITFTQIA